MTFPPGRLIAVLLAVAVGAGAVVLSRPGSPRADMTVWTFSAEQARIFRDRIDGRPSLVERFEDRTGLSVRVELLSARAIDTRLISLILSGRRGAGVPDLVELEIGSVGKFLRAAPDRIGLTPLNPWLRETGWDARLSGARLAAWSKDGGVFAAPLDVHPVALAYRKDLFDAAGVDPSAAKTWADFQRLCLIAQSRWGSGRHAIQMPRSSGDVVYMMLLQRGVNILEVGNVVRLDDPIVAETVAFYAGLVAGPDRIAAQPPAGETRWAAELEDGTCAAVFMPDWRIEMLKTNAPALSGKVRLMPLPRFEPSDPPTATWGGSAMAIPRGAADGGRSWRLLEALCLDESAVAARRGASAVLSADPSTWPKIGRPDAFFGGQSIEWLYVELAGQVPRRVVTPYTTLAMQALGAVVAKSADRVDRVGDGGRQSAVAAWLEEAAADVRRYIAFGSGEEAR